MFRKFKDMCSYLFDHAFLQSVIRIIIIMLIVNLGYDMVNSGLVVEGKLVKIIGFFLMVRPIRVYYECNCPNK